MRSTAFTTIPPLLFGSILASSAAIWIRFLPEVSPLSIGFIRVAGAAILFFPLFWWEWRRQHIPWRKFQYSALAGIALALHFATWIASLRYTTVAHSVLFVATHPIFVITISLGILRIPVSRNQIWGALIALAGVVFIQWRDLGVHLSEGTPIGNAYGNLLALIGGFFAAIYLLFSREARKSLATILHVEIAYSFAAVILLIATLILRIPPVPISPEPWLYLALLIILPTAGGHTIFNWSLRRLGAPLVSLFGLLEPVESAVFALLILNESIPGETILGGIVIIGGLALAVWRSVDNDSTSSLPTGS